MDSNQLAELREQYIKNPPEGMTPELVRDMTGILSRKSTN